MSNLNWGHHDDDDRDYLGTPSDKAFFDMQDNWDAKTYPHPNTRVTNAMLDYGKKYANYDPLGAANTRVLHHSKPIIPGCSPM